MKKYYTHDGTEQQGPFTIDELRDKKITKDSMIWFEGAEGWLQANKIDELKGLFKVMPPPFTTAKTPPPFAEPKPTKSNKTTIYLVFALLAVALVGGLLYFNQQQKQKAIERTLEEQNSKIREQERIEEQRQAEAARQKRVEQLQALKMEYDNAITSLRFANERLEQVKQFQLLRSSSEKARQIQAQLEVIRSWENEVDRLKKELEKY